MFFEFAYTCIGLIVAVMVVITARTLWCGSRNANAFRKRALSSRPVRDIAEMYGDDARFIDLDPHDFRRQWTLLADRLSVDPRRLRASDRFSAVLALPRQLRSFDPAQDLGIDLIEVCWRNGRDCPSQFDSVADFVGSATKRKA